MEWVGTIVVAIVTGVAGTGLGAWMLKAWQQWHQQHQEDRTAERKDEVEDRDDIWKRQAELITRQDKQLTAMQEEQARSRLAEMTCREEVAHLRAHAQWLGDIVHVFHGDLVKAGIRREEDLPKFLDFGKMAAATLAEREFTARSLQHGTQLVRTEASELRKSPPPEAVS